MAHYVAVCDGNWIESSNLSGNKLRCDGTLSQAAWPPPQLLPPLTIEEAKDLSLAFVGLMALVWVFTKLRAAV